MLALHELQRRFAAAVLDSDGSGFEHHIRAAGLPGARRLQVYRNNTRLGLTGALEAVYPVVSKLVGEGFFRYAAAEYIARHPSRLGDLHEYGGFFPAFLRAFEPAAELVYLPDVARLEWSYHQVFHAARHMPLDPRALASVPAERQGALRFQLHPAARLLESPFPILRIWQGNQEDANEASLMDLSEGGVKLLVFRRETLDIEFQPLRDGEFNLLRAFAEGCDFTGACERAMAAQPDFDLPTHFSGQIARGVVTAFELPDDCFSNPRPRKPS